MDFTADTSFEHGLFDFTVYSENSVFAVEDSNLMFVRDIVTFESDNIVGEVGNCPNVSEVLFLNGNLLFRFSLLRGSFLGSFGFLDGSSLSFSFFRCLYSLFVSFFHSFKGLFTFLVMFFYCFSSGI